MAAVVSGGSRMAVVVGWCCGGGRVAAVVGLIILGTILSYLINERGWKCKNSEEYK